eukprot:359068-Chlamydomonas_euryale.AAC.4
MHIIALKKCQQAGRDEHATGPCMHGRFWKRTMHAHGQGRASDRTMHAWTVLKRSNACTHAGTSI